MGVVGDVVAYARVFSVGRLGSDNDGPVVGVAVEVVAEGRQRRRPPTWVEGDVKPRFVFGGTGGNGPDELRSRARRS